MRTAPTTRHRILSIPAPTDRKSTRLNSSHLVISYAVFCLKKKKTASRHRRHGPPPPLPCTRSTDGVHALGSTYASGGRCRHLALPLPVLCSFFFFFNDTATPEIYPLPPPAPLPI